jgi:phenylacetate-coenzyme A ligase PaaK-like adenylate-forming protein
MSDYSPDTTGDHFEEIAATARQQLLGVVPEQVTRLHWDAASLAQYRSARLTETLSFAAEQSPWHAGRLSSLDLEAVTPKDLTSLPTMTKADLIDTWDRIVTDPRLSLDAARQHLARVDDGGLRVLLDNYFMFTTGGTTGQPGVFVWSIEEFARWGASTIRLGIDAGDPSAKRLTVARGVGAGVAHGAYRQGSQRRVEGDVPGGGDGRGRRQHRGHGVVASRRHRHHDAPRRELVCG